MYYCPKCHAEVPAQAHYCAHCGYRPTPSQPPQEQPQTPPVLPSVASASAHSIQPNVKHVLHRPRMVKNTPPTDHDDSMPDISTPAHILALGPVTPPGMSTLGAPNQVPVLHGSQPPQFQPNFLPPGERQPVAAGEPLSQPPQPGYIPSWPGQAPSMPQQPAQPLYPPQLPAQQPQGGPLSQPQLPQTGHSPHRQTPAIEVVKGRPQMIESHETFDDFDEGFLVTSQAAEHWRTSWRNRQRSEAGPATTVSRGQSLVPEPLMAMQHSLMRIRAVAVPQRLQQRQHNAALSFWITLFLLIGLILGLGGLIAYSYLPSPESLASPDTSATSSQPTLRLQGTPPASILQGQALHVHGSNFNVGAPIIFSLDGTTPINGTNDRQLAVTASDQGSFDAIMPTSTWPVGAHVISAEDNKDGESAYLTIQINLQASGDTASAELALSVSPKLTFEAVIGQGNPPQKTITLTNKTATTSLQWTASATVNHNLSWLVIDPLTSSGTLSGRGKAAVNVSVDMTGLQSSPQPYTGSIVFTINQTEQMVLPVELQVRDTAAEIVISPNPLVGVLDASGHACQASSQLLLVNISNAPLHWSISLNDASNQHIQFMHGGEPAMQGRLAPAGQDGDTEVLTLQCIQVHNEQVYSFTVVANQLAWPATVLIQRS